MKNKKLLYLLIAIVLLVGFMYVRNSGETGEAITDSLISAVTEQAPAGDDGKDISLAVEAEPAAAGEAEEEAPAEPAPAAEQAQTSENKAAEGQPAVQEKTEEAETISEDGVYDSKEEVALYIHTYGHLPSNYITKNEAKSKGWSGNGGDKLDKYCPGKCIGGDYFGNNEGILPKASGRKWTECDIDTLGASKRGIKRIVFSNDGLIYYTEDHYETFEQLY